MDALMIVAHPDDCIIFGYGIIYHCPEYQWNICYLTYTPDTDRGQEIKAFWDKRGVKTEFLGHDDNWRDIKSGNLSFDQTLAQQQIQERTNRYKMIVTHAINGEYGHPHHKFVHQCVTQTRTDSITFSGFGQGNLLIRLPNNLYDVKEIPIHYKSVGSFISPIDRKNEYFVPESFEGIISR